MKSPHSLRNGRFLFCVAVVTVSLTMPASMRAQEYKLKMRIEPAAPADKYDAETLQTHGAVSLRPNMTTVQRLILVRPNVDKLPVVKLVAKDQDGETELADGKYDLKTTESRLTFEMRKDVGDKFVVKDPRTRFQIKINDTGHDLIKNILEPRGYVTVVPGFDADKGRFHFLLKIEKKNDLGGARKCPVELVLGPQFEEPDQGILQNVLTELDQEVELFVGGARFRKGFDTGVVSLKIDGYDRAFVYSVNLKEAPQRLNKDDRIGLSLPAPLYLVPTEKVALKLEANGPLDGSYRLDVSLDRTGTRTRFQPVKTYWGLRQQQIELSLAKKGDLAWKTAVQDWQDDFNFAGVFNPVWIKVSVKKEGETKEPKVDFADGGRQTKDRIIEGNSLLARIIFDRSRPLNVQFVDLPSQQPGGKVLRVWATAQERQPDLHAPIDKVAFFYGKADSEGKLGKDAKRVEGTLDPDPNLEGLYFADIPLPEKLESLDLSVEFVTRTGMKGESKTETIGLKAAAGPAAAKSQKIKGMIRHGDSPQPDLKVGLYDEKGQTLKKVAKTNAKGQYVFEDVEPGNYIVSAGTAYPRTAGQTSVVVMPMKDATADVSLLAK